jgi:hypothetical protein
MIQLVGQDHCDRMRRLCSSDRCSHPKDDGYPLWHPATLRRVMRSAAYGAGGFKSALLGLRSASIAVSRDLQPAARVGDGERDRWSAMRPLHRDNPALARFELQFFV